MTNTDKKEFGRIWIAAYAMYGKDMTQPMLEMLFSAMENYNLEDIRRGLSGHVKNPDTGQFPPKPSDVIKHISGSSQSSAGEAWAKVDYAIRCIGNYRTVVFDDPKIHAAIERLGGWVKITTLDGNEYPFIQNHFLKIYQGFTVNPPTKYPNKMIGACEHQNEQESGFLRGKADNQPVLIGDKEKARLVYEGGSVGGIAQVTQGQTQTFLETGIKAQLERINKTSQYIENDE